MARTLAPPQDTPEKKGITGTGSIIGVLLSIANNGAPSIATNFRLGIHSDSLRTTLTPFRVSDGVVDGFNLRNDKRDIIRVIRASDTMVVKAINPITKGQPPVVGWLLYFLPIIDYSTLSRETEMKISFTDRIGQDYTVEIPWGTWPSDNSTPPSLTPDKGASRP
jgi:hypothetical protein